MAVYEVPQAPPNDYLGTAWPTGWIPLGETPEPPTGPRYSVRRLTRRNGQEYWRVWDSERLRCKGRGYGTRDKAQAAAEAMGNT